MSPPGASSGVAISGNRAFISVYDSGLHVADITNLNSPVIVGRVDIPDDSRAVASRGDFAYIANGPSGFLVANISSSDSPVVVGSIDTPDVAEDVALSGSYAFVADGLSGLQVVNIQTPSAPVIEGYIDTPGEAMGVAIFGEFAYIADGDQGLQVVDISVPGLPVITGSTDLEDFAHGFAAWGAFAYVTDGRGGLQIVDISNPSSPFIVGNVPFQYSAFDVAISGSFAYVAHGRSGLKVVDVTDPSFPEIVGNLDTPYYTNHILVSGDTAYISDGEFGFLIEVDISDPTHPTMVGNINTLDPARGVALAPSGICVVGGSSLKIAPLQCNMVPALISFFDLVPGDFSVSARWRISNDDELIEFRLVGSIGVVEWNVPHEQSGPGTYSAVDRSSHLTAARSVSYRLLVKSGADEWALLAEEEVTLGFPDLTTRILATSPNPFNPLTTVSFEIQKPIHVHLAVYDLSGRRVATLAEEWISAGTHRRDWDGRNTAGKTVAAGQYLLLLRAGNEKSVQKITLAK